MSTSDLDKLEGRLPASKKADKFEGEGSSSDSFDVKKLINMRRSLKGRLTKFEIMYLQYNT